MSNSKPVRLFHVPDLVREMIVAKMGVIEKFNISTCSKECFKTVKTMLKLKREHFTISLDTEKSSITVASSSSNFKLTISVEKGKWYEFEDGQEENHKGYIQKTRFNQKVRGKQITTFWEDQNQGMKLVAKHVSDLFGKLIQNLIYNDKSDFIYSSPLDLLEFLESQQCSIPSAKIILTRIPDDVYGKILNNLKIVENLHLHTLTTGSYFENNDKRTWEHEELKVDDGYWITPSRLLSMNCKKLIIQESDLTASAVNSYLKKWMKGSVPRLEQLYLKGSGMTEQNVMKGIEYEENPERELEAAHDNRRRVRESPLDIRRVDGTIGTVFFTSGTFKLCFIVQKGLI